MIVEGIPGRVEDLMTRDPMVIDQDAPLVDAAQLMDTLEITGLPVIDGDGRLVGVLSQTDVLRAAATRHLWHAWPGLAVRHLMTSPAIAVRSDCTLDDAAHLMEREWGSGGMAVLRRLKRAFDPEGILNPGKLGL